MTAGIYTVAYGVDYDRCAAHAMRHSRKFTNLPIAVATNLVPGSRCKVWAEVPNVQFLYFDRPQEQNRYAKLGMNILSPWDKTLYFDADSVVRANGIEWFVDALDKYDMVFNWRATIRECDRIWNLYARTMSMCGVTKPIGIHNGGIIAFRKGDVCDALFAKWLEFWRMTGKGREMPALNCAIRATGVRHAAFPLLYFADAQRHDGCIIQHNYGPGFNAAYGIPNWHDFKPFDNRKDDFRLESVQ